MNNVLVTGGAGYIGSHVVKALIERDINVIVLDSLITGNKEMITAQAEFYQGDIADKELVTTIVRKHAIDGVIHLAARSLVAESVEYPDLYFNENTFKTLSLLSSLIELGVKRVVFSSSASVYGTPLEIPITENESKKPISPYGLSKSMIEDTVVWLEKAYGLQWIALRYFNAAGASLDGSIGERHDPETHLIPLVLQTANREREFVTLNGTDYDTNDGTCIRDYIHVVDLAEVHILTLEALGNGLSSRPLNVGSGVGFSVREIINKAIEVTGENIKVIESSRRPGDPPTLISAVGEIKRVLGWEPKYSDLDTIVRTAWEWHRKGGTGIVL